MSPEIILYLLSWAVFYTGYDMPTEPPTIVYVSHQFFVDSRLCKGIDTPKKPCNIRALYDDLDTGVINLDEKYKGETNGYIKGIIVHEMVHYLQDVSGEWDEMYKLELSLICQARAYRQREAYMAQDNYNQDVHDYTRIMRRKFDKCGMR